MANAKDTIVSSSMIMHTVINDSFSNSTVHCQKIHKSSSIIEEKARCDVAQNQGYISNYVNQDSVKDHADFKRSSVISSNSVHRFEGENNECSVDPTIKQDLGVEISDKHSSHQNTILEIDADLQNSDDESILIINEENSSDQTISTESLTDVKIEKELTDKDIKLKTVSIETVTNNKRINNIEHQQFKIDVSERFGSNSVSAHSADDSIQLNSFYSANTLSCSIDSPEKISKNVKSEKSCTYVGIAKFCVLLKRSSLSDADLFDSDIYELPAEEKVIDLISLSSSEEEEETNDVVQPPRKPFNYIFLSDSEDDFEMFSKVKNEESVNISYKSLKSKECENESFIMNHKLLRDKLKHPRRKKLIKKEFSEKSESQLKHGFATDEDDVELISQSSLNKKDSDSDTPFVPCKRIAHSSSNPFDPIAMKRQRRLEHRRFQPDPSLVMQERLVKAKTTGVSDIQCIESSNKRTAHVPKQQSIATPSNKPSTYSLTQSPVKSSSDANKKVSTSMRQRYLAILTKKFKEIKPASEAQTLASQAEMNSYENCNSRSSYINLCVTAVKNIRSTTSACPTNIIPSKNNAISHEAILAGPKAARLIPHPKKVMKKSVEKLEGVKLYEAMLTYKMTEEQLVDNSYPRSTSNRNEASVYYPDRLSLAETTSKSCIRCGSNYKMNKDGSSSSECIYHWGNPFKQRIAGVLTTRYRCCQGDLISMGCSLAKSHVTENFDTLPQGYQKTVTRPLFKNQTHHGIFALDCEMCYTKDGLELTRVTVINENFDVVYESLVKPRNPILDYNTRFSGLSEKDFENLTTTLSEVQTHLLSRFSANSILIGHSLQSDLKALKLIHNVVVDTSIVFPHRRGPPLKRSLKNLMSEYLQKIIQENEEGHDSSEDAKACMELMLWRIKQDFKGVTCK